MKTAARIRFAARASLAGIVALVLGGCTERTVTIRTEPEGARVYLNDEDVGRSPVKVPFTWYGDYDIILRKEGHETLRTHYRVNPPWHQWPIIDLFTECLVPCTFRDNRELPIYTLTPATMPAAGDVILRAEDMRERALFGKD